MPRLKEKKGFSIGEMLAVVGIMAILAAVGVVGILSYLRSMAKMEYDDHAKELFIAAQNHLSMAESQGYLGREERAFGIKEESFSGRGFEPEKGVYVFAVRNGDAFSDTGSVLNQILPPSALDETVRSGGCYYIRYHKDSGQVLDVFYWEAEGRYALNVENIAAYYIDFMSKRENKNDLKNYRFGDDSGKASVVGYYGGVDALPRGAALLPPSIQLINAEKLMVEIMDPNNGNDKAVLKLEVTGMTSGNTRVLTLKKAGGSTVNEVRIILDDITTSGMHFYELFCREIPGSLPDTIIKMEGEALIPGEDITVQAVALNTAQLTNVAYSAQLRANSLFGNNSLIEAEGEPNTADISNIRHLENLDKAVSGVNDPLAPVNFPAAVQGKDLSWPGFLNAVVLYSLSGSGSGTSSESPSIYGLDAGSKTASGMFWAVDANRLDYDGKCHSISKVSVSGESGNAGLFGELTSGSVKNLKLVDFSVYGKNAGALAGDVSGTVIENVLALNSTTALGATITGSSSVGGLIGDASGAKVTMCAAALIVRSTGGEAGGLIGTAANTELRASYSAGHTVNGEYNTKNEAGNDTALYNVTAASAAGGLVGSTSGSSSLRYCYSTCSASGTSAGGLVGSVSGGSFADCYAAGLVSGSTSEGAFAGSPCTAERCWYFEIVNERFVEKTAKDPGDPTKSFTYETFDYLPPVPGSGTAEGIAPLDADSVPGAEGFDTYYNTFVGSRDNWKNAMPYDTKLIQYYNNAGMKYPLKTVEQLGAVLAVDEGMESFAAVHYGDWPAPELWVRDN